MTTTPQITGLYPAGGQITAIAAAGAAPVIVAGTDNKGEVVRWLGAERQVIATINEPATSVGVSEDGNVVSLVSKSGAMLWNAGRLSPGRLPCRLPARSVSSLPIRAHGVLPPRIDRHVGWFPRRPAHARHGHARRSPHTLGRTVLRDLRHR